MDEINGAEKLTPEPLTFESTQGAVHDMIRAVGNLKPGQKLEYFVGRHGDFNAACGDFNVPKGANLSAKQDAFFLLRGILQQEERFQLTQRRTGPKDAGIYHYIVRHREV